MNSKPNGKRSKLLSDATRHNVPIRMTSELHRLMKRSAAKQGTSLNEYAVQMLAARELLPMPAVQRPGSAVTLLGLPAGDHGPGDGEPNSGEHCDGN